VNPDSLTSYVVIAVATAVVGALSFLVKNAFSKVESTLETIGGKLDALKSDISRADGDRRVLEAEQRALAHRVGELERQFRELSEGVVR
jgi:predicted  nucleic acid-binding Zn-ribbon protein